MTNFSADELAALVRQGAADGLNLIAHQVQTVAVPRTPLEDGDLRSSLAVTPATPATLQASVSSDLPYAVRQHEELDYHHPEGQAKFLESAATDVGKLAQDIMATAVRRKLS